MPAYLHDGEAAVAEWRNDGLIQRDMMRVLKYLDNGELEAKQPTVHILVLAFAICSISYVNAMDRKRMQALVDMIIDSFEPSVEAHRNGDDDQIDQITDALVPHRGRH